MSRLVDFIVILLANYSLYVAFSIAVEIHLLRTNHVNFLTELKSVSVAIHSHTLSANQSKLYYIYV